MALCFKLKRQQHETAGVYINVYINLERIHESVKEGSI
jgi:hypothetical protein